MKIIGILFIGLIIIGCSSTKKTAIKPITFAENSVIAHRGAWKLNNLPQNSIASLKQAIALKCTGSEFDVRMTADDSLVVNHDPHFNNLPVETTNYAELAAFKLSNGEKLPTLREYIIAGLANNRATRLVCEIKPSEISKERGQRTATKAVALFHQLNAQQMVAYISFDYDILKKIIELNPKASTQYLEDNKSIEQLKADGIGGADYFFWSYKDHPELIESAKKHGLTLNAWTINETADMDWLISHNFDFITTDEPEMLLEKIKK